MKTRNGFVSNSSASSFVIASKGELTKEMLERIYPIPRDTPFQWIFEDMISTVLGSAEKIESLDDDLIENNNVDANLVKELFEKGLTVYVGTLSTDGEPIEWVAQNTAIDFREDDLVMVSDGMF